MYQIFCDEYPLFDPRDESLNVLSPKVKLEANTVGEGSFTILPNHPYFDKLKKLKSVFEVRQDNETIFRGRMTTDTQAFDNRMEVDLEGALACANDTIIPPFIYPDGFGDVVGKNLAYPTKWSGTTNGYTSTPNSDGSVTIGGSAASATGTIIFIALRNAANQMVSTKLKANTPYTLTVYKDGVKTNAYGAKCFAADGTELWGFHQTYPQDRTLENIYLQFTPTAGDTSWCGTYKVQLEEGATATRYEAYQSYEVAQAYGNVVEFFLCCLLKEHNTHVASWQKLNLGNVTVTDPNNFITRSSEGYATTWETLRSKLFESTLGGYLNVRYEPDGNYVDYLADFPLTNTQRVTFGENLLDLTRQSDATETYSAIMPFGAQMEDEDGNRYTLDLSTMPDGNITDDVVKKGLYLYSKSAVATYGWICMPIDDATWKDVTVASNLQSKAVAQLTGTSVKLSNTIELKALDLHLTDDEIQSFRVCRNLLVDSLPHGLATVSYQLLKMDIDIMNPQNTTITAGQTVRSLTDVSNQQQAAVQEKIEKVVKDIAENRENVVEVKNQVVTSSTEMVNTCNEIIMSAMTDYVQTGNFEQFQRTMEAQLKILSDSITMKFTETTNGIKDVNGDLQSKFNQLYKYIEFSGDTAITISSGDSTMTLEIDNENGIIIKQNGVQLGRWCGDTFESGNIIVKVNERAQFGDFAFIPRSDGSLQFLKVGG